MGADRLVEGLTLVDWLSSSSLPFSDVESSLRQPVQGCSNFSASQESKALLPKKKKSKPLVIHFSLGHLRAGLTKKVSFPGSTSAPCGSNYWWITFFVMQITCYLCDYSWLGALPWVNSNLLLISNLWAGPRVGSRSRKIHWSWARPNIYFNSDPGPPWTYTKLQPVYIPNWQTIIQSDLWGPVCSWTLDMKGLSNILCCQNFLSFDYSNHEKSSQKKVRIIRFYLFILYTLNSMAMITNQV